MNKTVQGALLAALTTFGSFDAQAIPITYSASFFGAAYDNHGQPTGQTLSGTFSFVFDDSVLTGIGTEVFTPPLSSLTLSPNPLGGTTFDLTNSVGQLEFQSGALYAIGAGGLVCGPNICLGLLPDWLAIDFPPPTSFSDIVWGLPGEGLPGAPPLLGSRGEFSFTATSIPEPATLTLLGTGIAGLLLTRRRQKVQPA